MASAAVTSLNVFPAEDTHGGNVVRADVVLTGSRGENLSASVHTRLKSVDALVLRDGLVDASDARIIRVSFVCPKLTDGEALRLEFCERKFIWCKRWACTVSPEELRSALQRQRKLMIHAQMAPHHEWMIAHQPSEQELVEQREEVAAWSADGRPLISIVTPVFNTPTSVLSAMVDSVLAQTYDNWELLLANASDVSAEVNELLDSYEDSRIKVFRIPNRSIAENTNVAIEKAAGGYVAFVDHDDLIESDALYQYVKIIHQFPDCDLLFSDEDLFREEAQGELEYYGPRFKPGWNYDLVLTHNYICHFLMVSRWALERTVRSDVDVSAAQDYDLTFKVAEVARRIQHVPRILYHWREIATSTSRNRGSKPYALEAGRLAVQHHLDRTGVKSTVQIGAFPFSYRVQYHLPDPAVGVTILLKHDDGGDLGRALRSICGTTEYPWDRYEVIVFSSSRGLSAVRRTVNEVLDEGNGTQFISCHYSDSDFPSLDWIEKGVELAKFDTVVLLNSFCEAVEGNWLTELIEPLQRDDVAVSSPLLLDGDDLLNCFGLNLDSDGALVPVGTGMQLTDFGYMSIMFHSRDCDVVPLAGAAFHRGDWVSLLRGDRSPCSFAACCLRARARGRSVVVEPYGPLRLWEDVTMTADSSLLGIAVVCEHGDSYLSPWLNPSSEFFALK